MSLIKLN